MAPPGVPTLLAMEVTGGYNGAAKVDPEIRELIRRMSGENPLWGAPRIVDELALPGVHVAKSTVEQYMISNGKPPRPRPGRSSLTTT